MSELLLVDLLINYSSLDISVVCAKFLYRACDKSVKQSATNYASHLCHRLDE